MRYAEQQVGPLDVIWSSFDVPEPLFNMEEVRRWPDGTLDRLLGLKLLVPAQLASHVACPDCPERHVEEVETSVQGAGGARYYIPCPNSLRVQIDPDLRRQ